MVNVERYVYTEVCDEHAPTVQRKVRGEQCPWLTDLLKERRRKQDYLHKVAIASGLSTDWGGYKVLRNEVNSNICSAKEKYYKAKLNETRIIPKAFGKLSGRFYHEKTKAQRIQWRLMVKYAQSMQ